MQIIEIVVSVITALGGWEMIKYLMNRKTNRRKEEAEADNMEFNVFAWGYGLFANSTQR